MKFGDKYELLESLTTGAVETFVANDKVRGERVLVHILHGEPQKPNQPTVQWVLDAFRRVAPEPVGLVLEAGRYSGTLYAYLITKLPEETALRGWVQQYKSRPRDAQETTATLVSPAPESKAPAANPTPTERPQTTSSVTQLLREFEPPAKSTAPSADPRETWQPSQSVPAPPLPLPIQPIPTPPLPTMGTAADQSRVRTAPDWGADTSRTSISPKSEPSAGSPAESFRPDFAPKTFPSEIAAPPAKDGPKIGEFTSFFQGPFRGDAPSEIPNVTPRQQAPQKTVGDFTSVFGSAKPQQEEPLPAPGLAGNEPAGSFTGWFNAERMSSTTTPPSAGLPRAVADPAAGFPSPGPPVPNFSTPSFPAPSSPAPVFPSPVFPAPVFPAPVPLKEPFVAPKPAANVAPAPPIFPTPTPSKPPASTLPSDGATGAFARPAAELAAPTPLAAPSGPGEYTRLISVRAPNPAGDAAAASNAPAGAAGTPAFAMPSIPVPAMAPPPLPPPPVPPKPALAAPAAPKAPKLPPAPKVAVPEPPVSYWPLVLTLTVLFFIAVLLVLYFVLKH
jgi:hypothetical protein